MVQSWTKHPILFIIAFFILLIGCIWMDGFAFPKESLMGLYLIPLIVAGVAFWRFVPIQIITAGLITGTRYYFEPFVLPDISIMIFQFLTYTLAILAVSTLIRLYLSEKENTLNVTLALAKSLDSRDPLTASHSENVAKYALKIALEMKLSATQCNNIYIGGLLHDIGKIGVPESILTKPSQLTSNEYEMIKKHPVIGYEMVKHIPSFRKNGVLDMIVYHHERYDGSGYPNGLSGEQIPQVARIIAVADSYDAMTSSRIYRNNHDINYAISEIHKNKGTQFDPEIADILIKVIEREH